MSQSGAHSLSRAVRGRATLDSVAALAGVSKQTVSNVINTPQIVRQETAAKVIAAIEELGYRPHRAAQQLRTRRSRVLGLRVENGFGDAVFDRFLHALTDAAGALDYRIMLYTAADDAAEITAYGRLLDRWDIDGIVLTATHPGDRRTTYLSSVGIPCVSFGRPWDDSDHHPWVDVDGAAGTREATEHLISLGHRRIGFLGWGPTSRVGEDRASGWATAMGNVGLSPERRGDAANDLVHGRAAAADLIQKSAPSALVCASDLLAIGAMEAFSAAGMAVGRQVAVVGFDNTGMAEVAGLTSIAQPLQEVARHCARLIVASLDGTGPVVPEQVLLRPSLVVRQSSAAYASSDSGSGPPGAPS